MSTEAERFWRPVRVSGMCWVRAQPGRYGQFEGVPAHRWAWEHRVGRIPPGLQVDHTCNNPPCVKIAHLQLVTPAGNTRLSVARGRKVRMHPESTSRRDAGANYRQLIDYLADQISSGAIAPGEQISRPRNRGDFRLRITAQGWEAACAWLVAYGLVERAGNEHFARIGA